MLEVSNSPRVSGDGPRRGTSHADGPCDGATRPGVNGNRRPDELLSLGFSIPGNPEPSSLSLDVHHLQLCQSLMSKPRPSCFGILPSTLPKREEPSSATLATEKKKKKNKWTCALPKPTCAATRNSNLSQKLVQTDPPEAIERLHGL